MATSQNNYDVIIAGAGPAGASAAIRLAESKLNVLLVEQKRFPREKLCGEFISPECQLHFQQLGVAEEMQYSGPITINETVFYSRHGQRVSVPSNVFGTGGALGLSRAVMDDVLLRRAQSCGVNVAQNATAHDLIIDQGNVLGVRVKHDGKEQQYRASLTIDATGRARVLAKKIRSANGGDKAKATPKLIAFKIHLNQTRVAENTCEIYFYPGGYGGLSSVESGLSNLCFIISAEAVKECHSNPDLVVRERVMRNPRAAFTLDSSVPGSEWLSASWERFGRQSPTPAPGLLAIGDSAAFIDPFTGSGMLMALESGQLAADVIVRQGNKLRLGGTALASDYSRQYQELFDSRLRMCSLLRRVAFRPWLAEMALSVLGASERCRRWIARATRSNNTKSCDQLT
jgi:flavin-dependent dehydrogenase